MDEGFAAEHPVIRIHRPKEVRTYTVFAVYTADTSDDCYDPVQMNEYAKDSWLQSQLSRASFDMGISLDTDDEVITLSTCVGGVNEYRTVVQAVCTDAVETPDGD